MRAASPRHAHADIALEGNARLAADLTQIAGIAVDADVAGQLAGDATAAFERGAARHPRFPVKRTPLCKAGLKGRGAR